jgi:acetolactate synthase-1/3 small subunit
MKSHVLAVLVENRAGTLSRVSGLFSRRGFNIDSLTVGETQDSSISRMTIAVHGDDTVRGNDTVHGDDAVRGDNAVLEQIVKQLSKLVDVIAVRELADESCLRREILLVKIAAGERKRQEIIQIADIFRGRVVDVSSSTITIEATGSRDKLEGLLLLLKPYGIMELARTGIVALERGSRALALSFTDDDPALDPALPDVK